MLAVAACAFGFSIPATAVAATDEYRADQWGLDAVAAPEAWQQSKGAGVIVAVIDSGVEVDHPDLAGNVWTNPDEVENGLDDDGNGIVDDVHGANVVSHNGTVTDELGHGTHIAGIIAAHAGNGIGGAGLAPDAQIMPIKILEPGTPTSQTSIAEGIRYAVDEGARILNISSNYSVLGNEMAEAVAYASASGATIVASAGNQGRDIDAEPSYPASVADPAVLTVAASDEDGGVPDSNYGARTVALAAPGAFIVSTVNGGTYEVRGGTSMAAPFVSGALALLAAARPDLSQAQLREALVASAEATPAVQGKVSAGLLDVGAAMHRIVEGDWGVKPVSLRVQASRKVRVGRPAKLRWAAQDAEGVATWSVQLERCRTLKVSGAARSASIRTVRRGRPTWTVIGYDADGIKLVTATGRLRVRR